MKSLLEQYRTQIVPELRKQFGFTNNLQVPRVTKVTLNSGTGKALVNEKLLEVVVNTLTRISGQRPIRTKARQSISAFKIREGLVVGVAVTLRGKRMYHFLEKLINIALPRVRDFQGIDPKSVDPSGNLTIGFKEHTVFPEIRSDEVESIHGLQVIITTSAKTKAEGLALLTAMGIPFKKNQA
ncbi:MAG: 50S ribosomal protein L5 [Candidatus Kerfeldbacteria bacterium]|nr:50S ribosomal protein L5 [Candidatus Kerfeldbacteria bacterium]